MEPFTNTEGESPPTLLELAAERIWETRPPNQILEEDPSDLGDFTEESNTIRWKNASFKIKEHVQLPLELWERFFECSGRMNDSKIWLMLALNKTKLYHYQIQKINVSNVTKLTDEVLESLVSNFPKLLNIHNCPTLTAKTFKIINKFGCLLKTLVIGNSVQILPTEVVAKKSEKDETTNAEENSKGSLWKLFSKRMPNFFSSFVYALDAEKCEEYEYQILQTPNLQTLVIWGLHITQKQEVPVWKCVNTPYDTKTQNDDKIELDYWTILMGPFIQNLVHLDLSYCQEFTDFNFLLATYQLQKLSFHDVLIPVGPGGWNTLYRISTLSYLNISQSVELAAVYTNPDDIVSEIVSSLPKLRALDISGTNLAGTCVVGINGLSNLAKPLDFLGLLGTHDKASKRDNLPAKIITGCANVTQILASLKTYNQHADMLKKSFRMFYFLLTTNQGEDFQETEVLTLLKAVLEVCESHIRDKHIQISGLCIIFDLMKKWKIILDLQKQHSPCNRLKNRIIQHVLKILKKFPHDLTLLRNTFLVCFFFDVAKDFNGDNLIQLVTSLLDAIEVGLENKDTFLLRCTFFLLKPLLVLSEHENRLTLGDCGVIEKLCDLVGPILELGDTSSYDYFLAIWIMLESLTDDLPKNAMTFAKHGGLNLFLQVKEKRPTTQVLTRAMGVLTNLACIDEAKYYFFRTPKYVKAIHELLTNNAQIPNGGRGESLEEINDIRRFQYSAVACMVHLLESDNYKCEWDSEKLMRAEICLTLQNVIESWDMGFDMQIEFRSLSPVLKTFNSSIPPCKFFAAWTIFYLIHLSPDVYVKMLGDIGVFLKRCDEILKNECNASVHKPTIPFVEKIVADLNRLTFKCNTQNPSEWLNNNLETH